jgi:sulfide:quinone oxidoreductase
MEIVIAGGGVAGLEALLGLHSTIGDRAHVTLIAPDPDFVYRPLAVAEPFALGSAHRVPLSRFAEETGAELVQRPSPVLTTRPARCGWPTVGRAPTTRR